MEMDLTHKIPCTVGVLTFNSGQTLGRCLESVKNFGEIIVCDGGSTDETIKIASKYNCTIIHQSSEFKDDKNKIADFSGVRNQMLRKASKDWFLILDSDEYLSVGSPPEINNVITGANQDTPGLFHVPRKFEVDGEIVECAGSYPSYQPRFFCIASMVEFRKKLHEKIVPKRGTNEGKLYEPTIVPLLLDYNSLRRKFRYYLSLEKDRSLLATRTALLKSAYNSLRGVVARSVKVIRSYLFCRGKKMPLWFEWLSIMYNAKLSAILMRAFIVKIWKK